MRRTALIFLLLLFSGACRIFAQDQTMKAHYIDVGEGATTLLEFPDGAILIDAGAKDENTALAVIKYLDDFFNRRKNLNRTLKGIIITHYHKDHVSVLKQIFSSFKVDAVIDNGQIKDSGKAYGVFLKDVLKKEPNKFRYESIVNVGKEPFKEVDMIGGTATNKPVIKIFWGGLTRQPKDWKDAEFKDQNNHSLVTRIDFGKSSFLFPGDIETPAINAIIKMHKELLDVDVLLVNRHGSVTHPKFFEAVSPKVAVISTGKWHEGIRTSFSAYAYGQPRIATIDELEQFVSTFRDPLKVTAAIKAKDFREILMEKAIYATCWDGTIIVSADMAGKISVGRFSEEYRKQMDVVLKRTVADTATVVTQVTLPENSSATKLLSLNPELSKIKSEIVKEDTLNRTRVTPTEELPTFFYAISFPKDVVVDEPILLSLSIGTKQFVPIFSDTNGFQSFLYDSLFTEDALGWSFEIKNPELGAVTTTPQPQKISRHEKSDFLVNILPKSVGKLPVELLLTKHLEGGVTRNRHIRHFINVQQRTLASGPFFYALIAGGAALLLGGGAAVVIFRRRKSKETKLEIVGQPPIDTSVPRDEAYDIKVAYLIGINDYSRMKPLRNPVNDAKSMSNVLGKKGFKTVMLPNPRNRKEILDGLSEFNASMLGTDMGVALFFFAGHGMQIKDSTFLIPGDVKLDPGTAGKECVDIAEITKLMEERRNKLNIIILDACRNNPFPESRAPGFADDFANINGPKGSYIIYSTAPDKVASDGSGSNGLFTSKLLKYIGEYNWEIEAVFKRVAHEVDKESNGEQRPWITSDFTGNFAFTDAPSSRT